MRNGLMRLALILVATFASNCFSADLSHEVRRGTTSPGAGDGGYFEIGLGAVAYTSPLYGLPRGNNRQGRVDWGPFVDINARYQFRGLFFEAFSQSIEELTLGYNFHNTSRWVFDLIAIQEHPEMSESTSKDYAGLNKRYLDLLAGPRMTGYLGSSIVQFHALKDISSVHHGHLYTAKIGQHWQHRNWNFHGILGATYRSREITRYYISVSEDEASERFPYFQAGGGGTVFAAEVGATYPLSPNWVFRGFVRRFQYPSWVKQSPLMVSDHAEVIAASINYVF